MYHIFVSLFLNEVFYVVITVLTMMLDNSKKIDAVLFSASHSVKIFLIFFFWFGLGISIISSVPV